MSRGWESKSVEEQQAEAAASKNRPKLHFTPDQITLKQEKESLLLSRKRIQEQIASARNVRHRQMLQEAIADLDAKIAALPEQR
jgi:hypothetical protein